MELSAVGTDLPRWSLLASARDRLAEARQSLLAGAGDHGSELDAEALAEATRAGARRLVAPFPTPVINATGIVLHTNLGRAPLAPAAIAEAAQVAGGYSDLELDRTSGGRGSRLARIGELLRAVSGAPAGLVVNNTAAALMLAVDTLAAGREVVLSRGELVEIGGSFRVPEIMAATRARLREIGTTNRTHLDDYRRALGPDTGALLKVHRSNFRVEGFTTEVGLGDLAALGREAGVPLVEDRGSGSFVDLRAYGIPEREAHAGLAEGANLVLFSGDKLLGGPQAGIALGDRELIEAMRRSPLARALRVDKWTLATLSWTLRAILDGREQEIPVLRMLALGADELEQRARALADDLVRAGVTGVTVERAVCPVGGGALPEFDLPGAVLRIKGVASPNRVAARLRRGDPPLLLRVADDALQIDPRTLGPSDAGPLLAALSSALR